MGGGETDTHTIHMEAHFFVNDVLWVNCTTITYGNVMFPLNIADIRPPVIPLYCCLVNTF